MINNPINANDPSGHSCVGTPEECLDNDGNPINGAGGFGGASGSGGGPDDDEEESPEEILKIYSDLAWNELTPQQQEALLSYQCGPSCWAENQSGSANDAEFWMDPLFYGEVVVGGVGVARAGVTLWEMASATLPILTGAGADGDPTNEAKIVYDIAQQVANKTGGVLTRARGDGWLVTLEGAAAKSNDIIAKVMVKGGIRLEPYYRVVVRNVGAVTSSGQFNSTEPTLTHHLINLVNPATTVSELTNLIQGLMQ